ncbi:MAG: Uncharacterised protein [Cryomorphaceae bacterium]|nr:MAG: Uncharacterised protein [Cryomorphaceae bacterium]
MFGQELDVVERGKNFSQTRFYFAFSKVCTHRIDQFLLPFPFQRLAQELEFVDSIRDGLLGKLCLEPALECYDFLYGHCFS